MVVATLAICVGTTTTMTTTAMTTTKATTRATATNVFAGHFIQTARKSFKRPNTREDSSDLDEKNTEIIAAMRSTSD